jgi:TolB-like protein
LQDAGDYEAAALHFERLAARHPGNADVRKHAATARGLAFRAAVRRAEEHLMVDDLQGFVEGMQEAQRIQPGQRVRLVIELVNNARARGEPDAAILLHLRETLRSGEAPAIAEALDVAVQSIRARGSGPAAEPIAVLALEGTASEAAKSFVQQTLSERLVHGGVAVTERLRLAQVLEEAQFTRSGVVDPAYASEVGRLTGARALVTGLLTDGPNEFILLLRVIDVSDARVLHQDTVRFTTRGIPGR